MPTARNAKIARTVLREVAVPIVLFILVLSLYVFRTSFAPNSISWLAVLLVIVFAFVLSLIFPSNKHDKVFRYFVTAGVPAGVLLITIGMLVNPHLIHLLSNEDGIIENLSAGVGLLVALIWFMYTIHFAYLRSWNSMAMSMLFAVSFFMIGMEELSWVQRILDVETSTFFKENNMQGEINLHNINTPLSEKIFYTGALCVLVALPFYKEKLKVLLRKLGNYWIVRFLPSFWLLFPFATTAGLLGFYKLRWLSVMILAMFCLGVLVFELSRSISEKKRIMTAGLLVLLTISFLSFIVFLLFNYDEVGIRRQVGSEYFELFVQVGFLAYTIDFIFRNTKFLGGKA